MSTGPKTFDLTYRAVDCIVPPDTADLAKEKDGGAVKRRVVAITEGKWNDTVFRPDELDKVPENTERRKGRDARKNLNVPLVIDHSDDLLKRIGSTLAITTGTVEKDGKQIKALILDHEFQQTTSVQKDVAALVKAAPDEILFSIRAGGDLKYDGVTGEYYWTDLWVDHNSIVTNPACANTGIVEELAKKRSDSPFYVAPENLTGMEPADFEKRLTSLEQSVGKIVSYQEKLIADQAAKDQAAAQEDLMERADTLAAIFALDPEAPRPFLKTLNKDQLKTYKADLERRKAAAAPPADGKGQAGGAASTELSLEQKAAKFLEG
jgi:hypothetical protein